MIIKLKPSQNFYVKLLNLSGDELKVGDSNNLSSDSLQSIIDFCSSNPNEVIEIPQLNNDYVIEIGTSISLSIQTKIISDIFKTETRDLASNLLSIFNEIILIE